MRNLHHLHAHRIMYRGTMGNDYNGAFRMAYKGARMKKVRAWLLVIASDGGGWDHVSVSVRDQARLPSWEEMHYIREQFFHPEETVMELHPPASRYVNNAEVLHLWRPQNEDIPLPPTLMVGIQGLTPQDVRQLVGH